MSTWKAILDASSQGAVKVDLPAAVFAKKHKQKAGRPRRRGLIPFHHYAGYKEERGGRPRCPLRGCGRWLKKDQRLACSTEHETRLVEQAKETLRTLDATPRS